MYNYCIKLFRDKFRFKALHPDWNTSTAATDFKPSAGRKNGLSIVLDMKPSERDIPSSVSNDFHGVEVNVGPRHTFPRLDTDRECQSSLLTNHSRNL